MAVPAFPTKPCCAVHCEPLPSPTSDNGCCERVSLGELVIVIILREPNVICAKRFSDDDFILRKEKIPSAYLLV